MNDKPKTQIGATLPLVVFALTALLGMAALAIDLSVMELARQRAQNVADAAALAGALSPGAESSAAASVTTANNSVGSALQGETVAVNTDSSVTVRGYVNAPLSFAPAVGYAPQGQDGTANTLSVSASATAAMENVCGLPSGSPVAPFGIIGDDPSNTDQAVAYVSALLSGAKTLTPGAYQPTSAQVVLKLNVWDSTKKLSPAGSFDPLNFTGNSADYPNTIKTTTTQALTTGQSLATLSGNNIFLTRQYVMARLAGSNTAYTHISTTYNAWFNGKQEQTEGHLMIVPVISQAVKDKPGNVTIIAFAAFYIDQPYPTNLSGNGIALGRFLGITVSSGSGGTCAGADSKVPKSHLLQ